MTCNQHGGPGWSIIGLNLAPILAARWAMFDLLKIGAEKFGLPAIWTYTSQASPDCKPFINLPF
jgi:hypothetical protein